MKRIGLLCSLILIAILVFSQDTVYLKGYYIERYNKKEILLNEQNKSLKSGGRSYEVMIDYKMQPFFLTTKVNSNLTLMKEDDIESLLCSNLDYKNLEVFKFPPFNDYIQSYFDTLNIHVRNTEFIIDQDYYINEKDNVYLYKLYHIEGYALRVKLENDYLNSKTYITLATEWDIIPTIINRNIPSFYVYLLYNYNIVSLTTLPKGFTKWTLH